ncbi:hypothetical protein LOK49_LG06G01111 [Camellia lanceoleosa]|uniref:Uncharacterized protein n=1 Tax=Camellia lanceoleosa TaxID=1840588 RepID=A0ACC0HIG2_9ERIC|nr:hypothetical protein LOK49_LG06G01111 [Camellia lanceoleosa]
MMMGRADHSPNSLTSPIGIEEVSPKSSPSRCDLKTIVIDECMSTVFTSLSLKRKAHSSVEETENRAKTIKKEGLTSVPIKTITYPFSYSMKTHFDDSRITPKCQTKRVKGKGRVQGRLKLFEVEVIIDKSSSVQDSLLHSEDCSSLTKDDNRCSHILDFCHFAIAIE